MLLHYHITFLGWHRTFVQLCSEDTNVPCPHTVDFGDGCSGPQCTHTQSFILLLLSTNYYIFVKDQVKCLPWNHTINCIWCRKYTRLHRSVQLTNSPAMWIILTICNKSCVSIIMLCCPGPVVGTRKGVFTRALHDSLYKKINSSKTYLSGKYLA